MITKNKVSKTVIKRKIDRLPDELLEKVNNYIDTITSPKPKVRKIRTYKLKGKFDDINISRKAYEHNRLNKNGA